MGKNFSEEDDALLAELGVAVESKKASKYTPDEERIIAGFEEIQSFIEEHGRAPRQGEDKGIFERLYAVRLECIRALQGRSRELVQALDYQGLLADGVTRVLPSADLENLDDDALLAELGVEARASSMMELKHVRSSAEKKAAEEVAVRDKCEDFSSFKPLFNQVQNELASGMLVARQIRKDTGFSKTDVEAGRFYILGGQLCYVAAVGEPIKAPNGEPDARLRVIFSNGTESNLLLRSLQRALYKDEASRMIFNPRAAGTLFADEEVDSDDQASGTIYVLRSKAQLPIVIEHGDTLHKIGVTTGKVKQRIANAKLDPTFLMADVEIIATYDLFNINPSKLEKLIHRIFDPARLEIEIIDRFGKAIKPKEWFLVPLGVIEEAIEKIQDGSISDYIYEPEQARLKRVG